MNILHSSSRADRQAARPSGRCRASSRATRCACTSRCQEGERERIQAFEGVCIARKNAGVNSNFTVRKISYGEGVERVFPLYCPRISEIEVVRRGTVRRAKLYYLRGRRGKAAASPRTSRPSAS